MAKKKTDAAATPGEGVVRVRFLEANASARGEFAPGDEAEVSARRARIWFEGHVVELQNADGTWAHPDATAESVEAADETAGEQPGAAAEA